MKDKRWRMSIQTPSTQFPMSQTSSPTSGPTSFDMTASFPAQNMLFILPPMVITSQYFTQLVTAAHHMAQVAALWHLIHNGEHHDGPPPLLRNLLYPICYLLPPQYEPGEYPVGNPEELADAFGPMTPNSPDTNLNNLTPLSQTALQELNHTPQDHPRDDWFFNHPTTPIIIRSTSHTTIEQQRLNMFDTTNSSTIPRD